MTIKTEETRQVQMRLRPSTIDKVERLGEILHTGNRTNVVRTSIDLAELILKAMSTGGNVVIEYKNGKRVQITIPGVG